MQKSAFPFFFPHADWGKRSRGLCGPRTPGSRAIGPAPVLRRGRLHLHSSFRMLLEETEQGAPRPPYPHGRAIGPAPVLRKRIFLSPSVFRMLLREPKREPTGAMKMWKKAGQESALSCRFFLIFPGCKASGRRCTTAQPVGGCATPNSQSFNRSFTLMCVRVALFHRKAVCIKQIANSGSGSRGDAPCGGGGGKAPPALPPQHREIACVIRIAVSGKRVQGQCPWWGGGGKAPPGLPPQHRETV